MIVEKFKNERLTFWLFALLVACLFLFIQGYQFNTDDQAEHLPQVYKLMDKDLYPHDYFVTELEHTFSLRSFFVWLVYRLSLVFPISVVCFVGTLSCITLSVYSLMQISTYYSKAKLIAFVAAPLIYLVFFKFTIGGNYITDSSFICSTLALALAAYGVLMFHRQFYFAMATILGVATLFQVMDAAQPFFLMALYMLFNVKEIGLKKLFGTIAIYLIVGGAMLFPMVYHQFFNKYPHDPNLYADIIYFFRNPNHFVPSSFSTKDYIQFSIMLSAGVVLLVETVRSNYRGFAFFIYGVILLGCIVYFVCFEVFHQFWIAKTQWFKATMWISSLSSIFVAEGLIQWIFKTVDADKFIRIARQLSWIGIPVLLFVILDSSIVPIAKLQGRYMVGNYTKSDLTRMHEWIAANTAKDVTILTPPSDFSFACEAKRSMPIGYKAIIHEPFFMLPWYKKFKDVYATALVTLNHQNALAVADSTYTEVLYKPEHPPVKIDFRLDNVTKCHYIDALGKEIHREGNYILTAF